MKRVLSAVLAVAALVVLSAPAAFAREVELSEIDRPVDAAIAQYPQTPEIGGLPGSEAVTDAASDEELQLGPFRHEGL